jgi:hypothetical protein
MTQCVLNRLRDIYGLKTVVLTRRKHTDIKGDIVIRDCGPCEFINFIKFAKHVVTTSFHGAAFSILYKVNFYCVLSNHSPARLIDLTTLFGFENQIITGECELQEADFSDSDRVIKEKQKEAEVYISMIIKRSADETK